METLHRYINGGTQQVRRTCNVANTWIRKRARTRCFTNCCGYIRGAISTKTISTTTTSEHAHY